MKKIIIALLAITTMACTKQTQQTPPKQKHSITLKAWNGFEANYDIGNGIVIQPYGNTSSVWTYTVDVEVGKTIRLTSKTFLKSQTTGVEIIDNGTQVAFYNAYIESTVTYTVK
jgi:hypothetical protein